jgi:hypothetical protein
MEELPFSIVQRLCRFRGRQEGACINMVVFFLKLITRPMLAKKVLSAFIIFRH